MLSDIMEIKKMLYYQRHGDGINDAKG